MLHTKLYSYGTAFAPVGQDPPWHPPSLGPSPALYFCRPRPHLYPLETHPPPPLREQAERLPPPHPYQPSIILGSIKTCFKNGMRSTCARTFNVWESSLEMCTRIRSHLTVSLIDGRSSSGFLRSNCLVYVECENSVNNYFQRAG